jgi:hypothetical protein
MVQKHACFSMVSRGLTHYRDTTYNANRIKTAYLLAMFDPSRTVQAGEARRLPRACSSSAQESSKSCIASQQLCT